MISNNCVEMPVNPHIEHSRKSKMASDWQHLYDVDMELAKVAETSPQDMANVE